jgi:hypothetical protein
MKIVGEILFFPKKFKKMESLDLFALVKCYTDQRMMMKQFENQLKSATLKTKSQR